MARTLKLTLTPAAEKAVKSGHPWVFSDRVKTRSREGSTGELAVMYDRRDRFLAVGLYDAASPICVRVLAAGQAATIDDDWFQNRVAAAVSVREEYFRGKDTSGYRWVNGENDGLPGMVVDRFGSVGVVKLYTAAWLPFVVEGRLLRWLQNSCPQVATWVMRMSRNMQAAARERDIHDGDVMMGDVKAAEVTCFRENGATLEAEPARGQKTGFFLDQRDNRLRVRELANGADVLNVFSHSGGFSVQAAMGGARSALDLDISKHALAAAKRNMQLNHHIPEVKACRHEVVQGDAFEWLAQARSRHATLSFDVVIIDPPSLAKRKVEGRRAIEAYQRLATNGLKLLRKGGVLVSASCSAHVSADEFFKAIREVVRRHERSGHELFTSRHAIDHPATIPEAHYLKCFCWKLDQ